MTLNIVRLSIVGLLSAILSSSGSVLSAQDKAADDMSGYGGTPQAVDIGVEATAAAVRGGIDTSQKPTPDKNYAYVVVTGAQEGGTGAFSLEKNGKGRAIARGVDANQKVHHVCTDLVGYGTTEKYWVYEMKNFKIGGKKVYHAFYKTGPTPTQPYPVFASVGDTPTDLNSFHFFGYATRGACEP